MSKPVVLILCSGNACRSHMAEGVLLDSARDLIEVHSAGSHPAGFVHPAAIEVMNEIGIDISDHTSKHMNDFLDRRINTVITVCENAERECPAFPGLEHQYHWGFEDPSEATGTEDEIMDRFRDVRDEIRLVFEAYSAGLRAPIQR